MRSLPITISLLKMDQQTHEVGQHHRESTVGSEYVRSRMGFSWQLYRVAPLMEHAVPEAVAESGLNEEVENLAKTLFGEIARSADETWNRVYAGKTEVTHKALSPLRTLQQKLSGLTFTIPT